MAHFIRFKPPYELTIEGEQATFDSWILLNMAQVESVKANAHWYIISTVSGKEYMLNSLDDSREEKVWEKMAEYMGFEGLLNRASY
ncbi:MAG: hypothetical protein EOO16_00330 [Chitinophagaceae bacterium]|nr:MAG: hypothetical protein EOO16_00330 [Chitinophagaceae bacterium]